MKKIGAVIAMLVGALMVVPGLIFLVAAIAAPQRLLPALALLLIGGALVGGGAWLFYRQQQLDPDALDDSIVSLARRSNAEVTVAQVVSELGVPDNAAHNALELLAHKGEVRRDWRDDRAVYMFPGLKESKVIRQCSHCGSQFSVAKHMSKCPNCGSTEIELVRT